MKKKLTMIFAGLMVLVSVLAGCGKAGYYEEAKGADTYSKQDYSREEVAWEYEVAPDGTEQKTQESEKTEREVKLVYTCRMSVETLEYKACMQSIRELVTKYDGFIQSESERDDSQNWYYTGYVKDSATMSATLVLRIPTKNYDAFLQEVGSKGKVTERYSNVDNITKKYYETETTIQSLTIQEERLLKMMEEAKDISEMLSIESRLTQVQSELAQYKNALASMDTDVDYSTVTLGIREVLEYTPEKEPEKKNTFGDRLKNTFKNTWEGLKEFGEGLLFFLIEAGPYLIIFVAIPLVILLLLLKKFKKQRAKKQAEAKESLPEKETKE